MYGIKIKELRENANLTQKELASKINSTQKQISKWETEFLEPNIYWLTILARFFDVSIDYLLGLEDENGRKIYNTNNTYNNYGTHKGDVNF